MWCLFDPRLSGWCKTDAHSTDFASNWLERLSAGSITTWEDLTTRFLAQFFTSGRTAKLRNDILMFQQHQGQDNLSQKQGLISRTYSKKSLIMASIASF
ncbi:zinc finger, CCHC-type containing protein [Tanacetum coccineum]